MNFETQIDAIKTLPEYFNSTKKNKEGRYQVGKTYFT